MKKLIVIWFTSLTLIACQERPEGQTAEKHFDESTFTHSNLPLAIFQTNGIQIPDEPKVLVTLKIINSPDGTNRLTDLSNLDYGFEQEHLYAGIETRGYSSQAFPKKQYSLELWAPEYDANLINYPIGTHEEVLKADEAIDDQATELLDMEKEEDWILYAPYSDKSLMRNVLAYDLARDISGLWQPQTRFVEVFFSDEHSNLDYRGVYVLTEKIKRDKNRLDLNKLKDDEITGEDLTGGYILELTPPHRLKGDEVTFKAQSGVLAINYPKPDDIQPEQIEYISNYTSKALDALYGKNSEDDDSGYTKYFDLDSLVNYILVHEFFKNRDTFSASTYFHKDRNDKLFIGPVWDFNISSGNDNIEHLAHSSGWTYKGRWLTNRLYRSEKFVTAFQARWLDLRETELSDEAITNRVQHEYEKLNQGAAKRNFQKWDILGKYVTFNRHPDFSTYKQEVMYLQNWLIKRAHWIDENIENLN